MSLDVGYATTTALTSSASSTTYGNGVQFTATISGTSGSTPTGMVQLWDGNDQISSTYLYNGVGTFYVSNLPGGDNPDVTAVYLGDGINLPSTSPAVDEFVNQAGSNISVSTGGGSTTLGQNVTFTATVTPASYGGNTPTGTVQFLVDGVDYGSPQPLYGNQAAINDAGLSAGSHTISAVYSGDGNYQGSTSTGVPQEVLNSQTQVTTSASPALTGQNVTFSATVAAIGSTDTPTGTVQFVVDGQDYGSPVTLDQNGQAEISDAALSVGTHSVYALYGGDSEFTPSSDASSPLDQVVSNTTTTLGSSSTSSTYGQSVTLTAAVTPAQSGTPTGMVEFFDNSSWIGSSYLDGNATATFSTDSLAAGSNVLQAVYEGDCNFTGSSSANLTDTVQPAATSTVVTASANPIGEYQAVTFTATISSAAAGVPAPSGQVNFYDGSNEIGSGYAYNGTANFYDYSLSLGGHIITADYEGSSAYQPSNSLGIDELVGSSTSVSLNSSASGSTVYGQAITFSANVSGSGGNVPTGSVSFFSGSLPLGEVTLDDDGNASLTTTALPAGSNYVTAVYSGDSNFGQSTSYSLYQYVQQDGSTESLTSSASAASYGAAMTLTATVSASSPGSGSPTGTVTFYEGWNYLGSVNLSGGQAVLNTSALMVGDDSDIYAYYSGDGNFYGGDSPSLDVQISQAASTTTVTSNNSPSTVGQMVTFTATVADADGSGTPTGTVQFQIDGSNYGGPMSLSNGQASVSVSGLSMGGHTVVAIYSGDSNFSPSDDTASPFTQTVQQAATTTSVTSSADTAVYGQSLTFTAMVSGAGSGTPTGTVQFQIDGSDYGSPVTLSYGQANLSVNDLPVGDHTVAAIYSGDSNFSGSDNTASPLSETISQAQSTASISSSNSYATYGQAVTLTAQVSAAYPSSGTPTGTVTFYDGGNELGTGTLANGSASFTTSSLSAGYHPSITAVYSGDDNFTGSSSYSFSENISPASTQTALSASQNPAGFGSTITFTALVSSCAPSTATPSGSVQFFDSTTSTLLGSANLDSTGMAIFATPGLGLGTHNIIASYQGNSSFYNSSNSLSESVLYSTSTAITSSENPANFGDTVVFTVTVTGSNGTPTGTVNLLDGGVQIDAATLDNTGTAVFTESNLGGGGQMIMAVYQGDFQNAGSSALMSLTVNPMATTTSISSSSNPGMIGQPVSYTVTVTPAGTVGTMPTGTVQLMVDGSAVGSPETLDGNGQATITDSSLTPGDHAVYAVYSGDVNFSGSDDSAAPLTQAVLNSVTSLTSSSDPSLLGQDVTFTATVSAVQSQDGTPSGSVQFQLDGDNYGAPVPVDDNGQAAISDADLPLGATTVTAVYSGDDTFTAGDSNVVTQTVTNSVTTLTSSVNPSVYGQSVTFTASVSAMPGVSGTPTGQVEFFNGTTPLGSATLNSAGVATLTSSALLAGDDSVQAVYGGDANFESSWSVAFTQDVQPAATATQLSLSTPLNQGFLLTATVDPVAPGGGVQTGTVIFYDGTTPLGTATVQAGTATFFVWSMSGSTHQLSAWYSGDANNQASTSNVLTPNIVDNTATTLSTSPMSVVYGQPVTFTATVTDTTAGGFATNGTVDFYNGTTLIGTAPVDAYGGATLTVAATWAGFTNIQAVYVPGSGYAGSASLATPLDVQEDTSTTTLTASTAGTVYGAPVTLTATVTPIAFSAVGPTGLVYFYDGVMLLGWAPLNSSGVASIVVSNLSVGVHSSVTATYFGNIDYLNSYSTADTIDIVQDSTTTTVTSSAATSVFGQDVTFTATVTANSPGTATPTGQVQFLLDGVDYLYPMWLSAGSATVNIPNLLVGAHTISVQYLGDVNDLVSGNQFEQTVLQSGTTTALSTLTSSVDYSQTLTVTATVNPSGQGAGMPTGTVDFDVDGVAYGAALLTNGQATMNITGLPVGSHTIVADYDGDGNFDLSDGTLIVTVTQAATTTALSASTQWSMYGQAVTFTATAFPSYPSTGTPTGSMLFWDGSSLLGVGALVNGTATLTTSGLDVGDHPSIQATYSGDGNFSGSLSALIDNYVYQAETTTVLTSSANPSTIGADVTFTATVAGAAPSTAIPTGTVQFVDSTTNTVLGSAALNSAGAATFTTNDLGLGNHGVVANYEGTDDFQDSSGNVTQTVGFATFTTLTSSANPSTYGSALTFTATVTGANGTPTGWVQFFDGDTALGWGFLNNGVATLAVNNLAGGDYTNITAVYLGAGSNNPSTSAPFNQVVQQVSTSTSVSTNQAQITIGQSVTLTATVTPAAYVGVPAGTVQFYIDGNPYGSAVPITLLGLASVTVSSWTPGSHSITAMYSGDSNFAGSNSDASPVPETVLNSQTSVSSSASPSVLGQDVTFTATVGAVQAGGATPTGTVQFQVDGVNYGLPVPLDADGQAAIDDSSLTLGSHVITAMYSGDDNFTASDDLANPCTQIVQNSTTSLSSSGSGGSVFGQSVTLTASVLPSAAGAVSPTGYVQFWNGSTLLGTTSVSASGMAILTTTTLPAGTDNLQAVYLGDSNFTTSSSAILQQQVQQAGTSTSISLSALTSGLNQTVTLTATVSVNAPGGGPLSGTVIFYDGGNPIGSTQVNGSGMARLSTGTLSLGGHNIYAVYQGDTGHLWSASSTISQNVLFSSQTSLSSSTSGLIVFGTPTTLTATVAAVGGSGLVPTGFVMFCTGSTPLGVVALDDNGMASLTVDVPGGSNSIQAVYSGDVNFAPSTSPTVSQPVQTAATFTILSNDPTNTVFSAPVTLTAAVSGYNPGAPLPTGNVTFYDAGRPLGSALLNNGVATLAVSNLSLGDHPNITAVYGGDGNYMSSPSQAVDEFITQDTSSTSVASNFTSSVVGQTVTFTASVTAGGAGTGTPTGTVQFVVDGSNYGSPVTLSLGQASINMSSLSLGQHSLAAIYSGDANFTGSDDMLSPFTQTVNPAVTPIVTGLGTSTGSTGGGASVLIAGTGFYGTSAVYFGTTPAMYFAVMSDTQIVATAPAQAQGTVDVAVTNSAGTSAISGADQFTYAVPAVTVTAPANQSNFDGDAVQLAVSATDSFGAALTYSANLPSGLSINPATGVISGTIAANADGNSPYFVTVTATDVAANVSNSASFVWTVTQPTLSISDAGAQSNFVGDAVQVGFTAFDSAAHSVTFGATGLPAGLSINRNTGVITGTIANGSDLSSPYLVTVTATDSAAQISAVDQIYWFVTPTVVQLTNPGAQYSYNRQVIQLPISGSDSAGHSLVFGASGLPAGLTINSSGVISGTVSAPTSVGYYNVTVTARDNSTGVSTNVSFVWQASPLVITVTNPGSQTNYNGDEVNFTLSAYDSAGNAVSFSAINLPAGLTINSATGTIYGTVAAPVTTNYFVTIVATDTIANVGGSTSFSWNTIQPQLTGPTRGSEGYIVGALNQGFLTGGFNQPNQSMQLFQPISDQTMTQLGLTYLSIGTQGNFSLVDDGTYQLDVSLSGSLMSGGSYYFTESGLVTFSYSEYGTLSNGALNVNSVTLTQAADVSWIMTQYDANGNTVAVLGGVDPLSVTSQGSGVLAPYFWNGFSWLAPTQKVWQDNVLNLSNQYNSTVTVTETAGNANYLFNVTGGRQNVTGRGTQPLANMLQTGVSNYSYTLNAGFTYINSGGYTFTLSELGSGNVSNPALSSVA